MLGRCVGYQRGGPMDEIGKGLTADPRVDGQQAETEVQRPDRRDQRN